MFSDGMGWNDNYLNLNFIGQVEDLIGVAEAGFKSALLNSNVNVKTADKNLQFGTYKCKTMLVLKIKSHSFD